MNLRDVIIGAVATLVVTVLGGVAVYYLTKEGPPPRPSEQLVYEAPKPLLFHTEKTHLAFLSYRLGNLGDDPAHDVRIGLRLDSAFRILDFSVSTSAGPAGTPTGKQLSQNELTFSLPSLTPEETAIVSLIVDGPGEPSVGFGAKSLRSTAKPGVVVRRVVPSASRRDIVRDIGTFVVPLALIVQLFLLVVLRPRINRVLRRYVPTFRSINNTAFLYIHQGLVDKASALLEQGISRQGADASMLANYGLCVGLAGDFDSAFRLLDAAQFWSPHGHERAVVSFNRAILRFRVGDHQAGLAELEKAFALSRSELRRYCAFSVQIQGLRANTPSLDEFLAAERVSSAA